MFCCSSSLHSPPPSLPPPHTSWVLVPFRLTLHCVSDTISMSNSLAMQSRRKDSASARKKVVKGKMKHRKSNTLTVIITVFKLHKDHHAQREQERRSFLSLAAFPELFCSQPRPLRGKQDDCEEKTVMRDSLNYRLFGNARREKRAEDGIRATALKESYSSAAKLRVKELTCML